MHHNQYKNYPKYKVMENYVFNLKMYHDLDLWQSRNKHKASELMRECTDIIFSREVYRLISAL